MSGTPRHRNRLEEQVKNRRSRKRNARGGMEQSLEESQRTGALQAAEAQNGELEGIRSETEAEKGEAELKMQRKNYLNADLVEL